MKLAVVAEERRAEVHRDASRVILSIVWSKREVEFGLYPG
jgi:hypothetical protein